MYDSDCRLLLVKNCNEGGDGTFCLDVLEFIQDRHKSLFAKCFDCPFYLIWTNHIDKVDKEEVSSLLRALKEKENE